MYLGENTVAGRIYDKIKRIVKDLRFEPDDEEGRKKAKHLLTLRRYIQFSVMLTGFFLIMSAVNIYQKSWAMFQTTVLEAAITCVFAIVGGCKKFLRQQRLCDEDRALRCDAGDRRDASRPENALYADTGGTYRPDRKKNL